MPQQPTALALLVRDDGTWRSRGVHFIETPRDEPPGRVVFEDLYGNRRDLIERRGNR